MASNRFEQLTYEQQLLSVAMNEVKILLPGSIVAIGTKDLNGCTAIAILGRAIILAHISPRPTHSSHMVDPRRVILPDEGDDHFNDLIDTVQQLYNANRACFPTGTTAWGIFGRYERIGDQGQVEVTWMPEKLDILGRRLSRLGLPTTPTFYDVRPARERLDPAAGTVIGLIMNGNTYLYVEDVVRHSINFDSRTVAAASTRSVDPSSRTGATASRSTTAVQTRVASLQELQAACIARLASSTGLTRETVRAQLQHYLHHHTTVGQIQVASQTLLRAAYDVLINRGFTLGQARALVASLPKYDDDDDGDGDDDDGGDDSEEDDE